MKRSLNSSSSSLGALMSICPPTEEQNLENNHVYSREFQPILENGVYEEEEDIELEAVGQRKRRLSVEQVKALEKDYDVDNKLEPERKAKLAHYLGLQPRQVAVWFQNRRARWKTKQVERDYAVLKSNYDSLKQNVDSLKCDNQALFKEIRKLKSKLNEEGDPDKEALGSESDHDSPFEMEVVGPTPKPAASMAQAMESKDGQSDSDSSAILNVVPASDQLLWEAGVMGGAQKGSSLFVKMEEEDDELFFSEEACNFFSEDQAPTLHWDTPHNCT